MRRFELPELLFNLSRSDMQSNYPKFGEWKDETKQELIAQLTEVEHVCRESGLSAAKAVSGTIERIKADDTNFIAALGHKISAVRNEIVAQLEQFVFLEIPANDVPLYLNPRPFGDEVFNKLPACREDLEEAATCLALWRGTACVMHLSRAMEHALRELAVALKATIQPKDGWDAMLTAVDDAIALMGRQTQAEIDRKDAAYQARALLASVKLAWRHPFMHGRGCYKPDQANGAYNACGAFLQHIVTVI